MSEHMCVLTGCGGVAVRQFDQQGPDQDSPVRIWICERHADLVDGKVDRVSRAADDRY